MYELLAFVFFSILTLGMFTLAVFSQNILHAISALAGGMIFISGFFFLLGAEFLGVIQLLVYVGAVVALYAFGMMLFNLDKKLKENQTKPKLIYSIWILASLLIVLIVILPIYSTQIISNLPINSDIANTQAVGYVLFTKYLVPFELAAVMLLVAMIAGIVLTSKDMDESLSLNDDGLIIKEELV